MATKEGLGPRLRHMRRKLGLTLDELAVRTGISKPYLSLIETERTPNPPSDEKLRKLELALGFPAYELVTAAHLARTPADVRLMLQRLIEKRDKETGGDSEQLMRDAADETARRPKAAPISLDTAYLSGVLQELVEGASGNVQQIRSNAVPIINKVSAGYPKDFTDLGYPAGVADSYITCPDLADENAFAARVCGDSMSPKYREDDVVVFSPALMARSGDDCFVRFEDGQTTFKRVFFETDEAGKAVLRLQPRNEKYRPQMISSEKVTGLYKAFYKFQRVEDDNSAE